MSWSPFGAPRVLYRSRRVGVLLTSLVAVFGGLIAAVPIGATAPAAAANWSPVHPGDFPDPSVLQYQGTYYGFATQSFASLDKTINIQVSTSSDGVNWTTVANSTVAMANLSGSLLEGFAVTSHNSNQSSTVVYDTVVTTP